MDTATKKKHSSLAIPSPQLRGLDGECPRECGLGTSTFELSVERGSASVLNVLCCVPFDCEIRMRAAAHPVAQWFGSLACVSASTEAATNAADGVAGSNTRHVNTHARYLARHDHNSVIHKAKAHKGHSRASGKHHQLFLRRCRHRSLLRI